MEQAGTGTKQIDFISAHGTATIYNDEMEAKAFNHAALSGTPVNSLKGYFGHTLGAAGLLESVISILSLEKGITVSSAGFDEPGVSVPINVIQTSSQEQMHYALKTASGFGGCNAAAVFYKK
jgi:3-oxoacyl-[acyl-carrier-protein] synthase-1